MKQTNEKEIANFFSTLPFNRFFLIYFGFSCSYVIVQTFIAVNRSINNKNKFHSTKPTGFFLFFFSYFVFFSLIESSISASALFSILWTNYFSSYYYHHPTTYNLASWKNFKKKLKFFFVLSRIKKKNLLILLKKNSINNNNKKLQLDLAFKIKNLHSVFFFSQKTLHCYN